MGNLNLFQLSKEFEQSINEITVIMESDDFTELSQEQIERLLGKHEQSAKDFEEKAYEMGAWLIEQQHLADIYEAEEKRFQNKKKARQNQLAFFKNLMLEYMQFQDKKEIGNDHIKIKRYKNTQYSTKIRDKDKLPDRYKKVETKANTQALKKDLLKIQELQQLVSESDDDVFKQENAWVNEVAFNKGEHIRIA